MATTHRFHAQLVWEGSTGAGYRDYSRAHVVTTAPVEGELAL